MAPLAHAIHVEFSHNLPEGVSVFKGNVDPEWTIGALPNGGYVLSLIIEAATKKQASTAHPDPIHVSAHFLRSASTTAFEVHIQVLKTGRGFTNLTANFIQDGQVKIMSHMLFGVLAPTRPDPSRPTLTVEPPSPYARRIPFHTHPSKCSPVVIFAPFRYVDRIAMASDPAYVETETPKQGLDWGFYLTLTDPSERWTSSALGFAADNSVAIDAIMPSPHKEARRTSWRPTMVMNVEFKFPIPKPSSPDHSTRTVAIYSASKFMNDPQARHDVYLEIWTAPSNIGEGPEQEEWREKQRCLAVATQMAVLLPMDVNKKIGQQKAATATKL